MPLLIEGPHRGAESLIIAKGSTGNVLCVVHIYTHIKSYLHIILEHHLAICISMLVCICSASGWYVRRYTIAICEHPFMADVMDGICDQRLCRCWLMQGRQGRQALLTRTRLLCSIFWQCDICIWVHTHAFSCNADRRVLRNIKDLHVGSWLCSSGLGSCSSWEDV